MKQGASPIVSSLLRQPISAVRKTNLIFYYQFNASNNDQDMADPSSRHDILLGPCLMMPVFSAPSLEMRDAFDQQLKFWTWKTPSGTKWSSPNAIFFEIGYKHTMLAKKYRESRLGDCGLSTTVSQLIVLQYLDRSAERKEEYGI